MSEVPADRRELRAFAADALGSIRDVVDRSRSFGRRSATWKITVRDGEAFYLKRHEERRLFETELIVYTKWLPKLLAATELNSPSLVAVSQDLGALLLTEAPGEILEETDASTEDQIAMYCAAGRVASQIHQLDVDPHEAGPERLYDSLIWERYLAAAVPYLDAGTLRWIERTVADDDLFHGLDIVPTHADFSPRNWLIARDGPAVSFGLIDWERARAGYWPEDAQRLAFDYWLKEPRLREAYFEGYGRMPTLAEERQMNLICLANALGTVSWATEREDFEFAEFGRRTIELLRRELS